MRRLTCGLLILCVSLLSGCGGGPSDIPELATVSGVVKLDGQPLPGATVTFSPEKGRGSTGETDANGRYELRYSATHMGAVIGRHLVSISTRRDAVQSEGVGESKPAVEERVPRRYNEETQMTQEVKSGANTIDFDLQTKSA